jgi:hypothetical protein
LPWLREIVDLVPPILELPMAGFEPARAYLAQRILSPLRLPFRHIGAAIGQKLSMESCARQNEFAATDFSILDTVQALLPSKWSRTIFWHLFQKVRNFGLKKPEIFFESHKNHHANVLLQTASSFSGTVQRRAV